MITSCPKCQRRLKVPDGAVGRRARCPSCQNKFVIADPLDTNFDTIAGFVVEESGSRSGGAKSAGAGRAD